ncbi:hypothetical protein EV197_1259 [Aquimarina brevivitae]|uniref:Peptidase M48 domain-containing protein n=2 Tax=Aquimarina brevivitae TaxID=323412 RepID=A0A4Q7PJ12_9FLAO|nr:hypothetical protein EV197_1259 [Aquimarina brevivitae]
MLTDSNSYPNILYQENKQIPVEIYDEVKKALSFYPELENITIDFEIRDTQRKSFMKAQPKFRTLLKGRRNRAYKILISKRFTVDGLTLALKDLPKDVLVGWIGHELGHIMDYKERSTLNLLFFGIKYLISGPFIRKAEYLADYHAVANGMADYILKTKHFILNHSELSDGYKERIKRFYVSPDRILLLVNELQTN